MPERIPSNWLLERPASTPGSHKRRSIRTGGVGFQHNPEDLRGDPKTQQPPAGGEQEQGGDGTGHLRYAEGCRQQGQDWDGTGKKQ